MPHDSVSSSESWGITGHPERGGSLMGGAGEEAVFGVRFCLGGILGTTLVSAGLKSVCILPELVCVLKGSYCVAQAALKLGILLAAAYHGFVSPLLASPTTSVRLRPHSMKRSVMDKGINAFYQSKLHVEVFVLTKTWHGNCSLLIKSVLQTLG